MTGGLDAEPHLVAADLQDGDDHVRVATVGTKLQVDVVNSEENVHVAVPLTTVNDVALQIADNAPGI